MTNGITRAAQPPATTVTQAQAQAQPQAPGKEVSKLDIDWALKLEKKVKGGHQPTEKEIARYQSIATRLEAQLNAPAEESEEIKGLIDYPKDILQGITNFAMKLSSKNSAEASISAQRASDSFSGAWEDFKEGNLDQSVEKTIEGFGDVFSVIGDGITSMAGAMVGSVALVPTALVDGADMGIEWLGKQADGSDNNWAKTVGTIPRLLAGKNTSGEVVSNVNNAIARGFVEGAVGIRVIAP